MVDHIHLFKPGASVTFVAEVDVIGGRLVEVSGNREVSPAAAASTKVIGAAATDTKAGEDVLVLRGGIQRLVASAAIAAGARVQAAADGKVVTLAAGTAVGIALTAATAADQLIQIALD